MPWPRRRAKYGNRHATVDGRVFDSQHEAGCYLRLKAQQQAGLISGLECQPVLKIVLKSQLICRMVPDFRFLKDGQWVYQDAKGMKRGAAYAMFRLKAKLVQAVLGIQVEEI